MKDYLDRTLKSVLARWEAWGPAIAVELQVILLAEMWHVANGTSTLIENNALRRRWSDFIGGPGALADQTKADKPYGQKEEFIDSLRDFFEREKALSERELRNAKRSAPVGG